MIKYLRSLFCRHNWKFVEHKGGYVETMNGMQFPVVFEVFVCSKCGKGKYS